MQSITISRCPTTSYLNGATKVPASANVHVEKKHILRRKRSWSQAENTRRFVTWKSKCVKFKRSSGTLITASSVWRGCSFDLESVVFCSISMKAIRSSRPFGSVVWLRSPYIFPTAWPKLLGAKSAVPHHWGKVWLQYKHISDLWT